MSTAQNIADFDELLNQITVNGINIPVRHLALIHHEISSSIIASDMTDGIMLRLKQANVLREDGCIILAKELIDKS